MPSKTRKSGKDLYIDMEDLQQGLVALEDTTKAPFGSARVMKNMQITDRGGVGPRPGTELLGTLNSSTQPVRGLYNFRQSFEQDEILLKTYDNKVEAISKANLSAGWFTVETVNNANKEFGFVTSLVNETNSDYVVYCNRFDPYRAWTGVITQLNGALTGGETTITVDSTLTEEIFESKTATGATTTTITVAGTPWAANQWIGLYVYITSGAEAGQIRKITASTNNQITFTALGSNPGAATFEIRKLLFKGETGTIVYAGTPIAYTAIATATTITVASAHAGADNALVTEAPTEYPANPRGNRFANYLGRIIVGNVRSAVARGSGGAQQGYASGGSYFVSQINDPFDYTFSANRVAGEGDIVGTPYGGGEITDVAAQEDTAYVFKNRYIEAFRYTQDSSDLVQRQPLKSGVGSQGQVISGTDDIYFITPDNKFTSIGRVKSKDILPQTENIGYQIKRLLDTYNFGQGRGIEYKDKVYFPARSNSSVQNNDVLLVFNKNLRSFEGVWDIALNFMEEFNEKLYYGDSLTANVYEMLTGTADVEGDERFGINATYRSHFFNLTPSHGYTQALNSIYVEGYIKGGSEIKFEAWKDFVPDPFLTFTFGGSEKEFIDGKEISAYLGSSALGTNPTGSVSQPDADGRRHFYFRVYFPFKYGNHLSVGFSSAGVDDDYEITRMGLGLKHTVSVETSRIKNN